MGAVLIGDAVRSFWRLALVPNVTGNASSAPSFKMVLGKIACTH